MHSCLNTDPCGEEKQSYVHNGIKQVKCIKTHFIVSSPPLVECATTPKMHMQSGYFLAINRAALAKPEAKNQKPMAI